MKKCYFLKIRKSDKSDESDGKKKTIFTANSKYF